MNLYRTKIKLQIISFFRMKRLYTDTKELIQDHSVKVPMNTVATPLRYCFRHGKMAVSTSGWTTCGLRSTSSKFSEDDQKRLLR